MRIWATVVMIVEPPAAPTARTGRSPRVTSVGAIELRGRLPPAGALGASGSS